MELIIGLISGAIGGNVAGGVLKNLDQGALINSLSGIGGGVVLAIVGAVRNAMGK